jgi:O-methyltransferase
MNRILNPLLKRAGYILQPFNRGQVVPAHLSDPESYARPEDFSRLYRPWLNSEATRWLTSEIQANTMLSRQKLYMLRKLLAVALRVEGDVFEAGAGSGGSAKLLVDYLAEREAKKTVWVLDTFEGYQKIDPIHDGSHVKLHQCRCKTVDEVRALLKNQKISVHLVKGLIPGTLVEVGAEKIAFAHIDVNLYEPTLAATEFCLQRMPVGGCIVFDDYGWPATYGARKAIDAACERFNQEVICVPETTQAFLIRI